MKIPKGSIITQLHWLERELRRAENIACMERKGIIEQALHKMRQRYAPAPAAQKGAVRAARRSRL